MDRTLEQWRDLLYNELQKRRTEFIRNRRYYDGDHVRVTAPDSANDKYLRLAQLGVTNMCGLVVDTIVRRLIPNGVRLNGQQSDDIDVWRDVWQANNLDGDITVAFEETLKVGRCPILVWKDGDAVTVTIEDPDETIVAYQPGSRRTRIAALKAFVDGDSEDVTLWTPTEVMRWVRPSSRVSTVVWLPHPTYIEGSSPNPFESVPVVELRSKPDIKGCPKPEISLSVIRLQDRINKSMFDAVVGTEDGAFPQRYTIGIEIETDDDGNPINPLTTGPNRVWGLKPDGDDPSKAQIGQIAAYDITGLLKLADASIQQLASISVTPIFYLLAGMTNVGSDTIRAAERGHVDKCRSHQVTFDDTLEEVFRLGMIGLGMEEPPSDIAIDWEPLETRSPAELADAAIKMHTAGYPFVEIVRYMGATQSDIERVMAEKAVEEAAQAKQVAEGVAVEKPVRLPALTPA